MYLDELLLFLGEKKMPEDIRNVFISHIHEDDEGLPRFKRLLKENDMVARDYSITADKPNQAKSEDYIKSGILAPQINACSILVVYISSETKNSEWVNWEIEYAHKKGKRIVGVWERGERDCEIPEALDRFGDALVGWNGESIIDAINGKSDKWYRKDGADYDRRNIKRVSC